MDGYDLVCDVCGLVIGDPVDGLVSWTRAGESEDAFALTHAACVPAGSDQRLPLVRATSPNGFLRFTTERFSYRSADPAALAALVSTLALFALRWDTPAEMERLRGWKRQIAPQAAPTTSR